MLSEEIGSQYTLSNVGDDESPLVLAFSEVYGERSVAIRTDGRSVGCCERWSASSGPLIESGSWDKGNIGPTVHEEVSARDFIFDVQCRGRDDRPRGTGRSSIQFPWAYEQGDLHFKADLPNCR